MTRVACAVGVASVMLFFKYSSYSERSITLYGLLAALVAIVLGFTGYVLGHQQRRRYDTSETTIALVSSCLTIVLTIGSWAALTHLSQISSTLNSIAADETPRPISSERPAWMTAPKDNYRVAVERARNLY